VHRLAARRQRVESGCESLGISLSELARRVGKSRQQLYMVLAGTTPGTGLWEPLARELSCDVTWLTTGRGPAPVWWAPTSGSDAEDVESPVVSAPGGSDGTASVEMARLARDQQREIARLLDQVREVDAANRRLADEKAQLSGEIARLAAELDRQKDRRRGSHSTPRPG
jgi:hypothetical protein